MFPFKMYAFMKNENDIFLFNIRLLGGVDKQILKMRKSIILILTALFLANSGFCQYLPKFRSSSQQEMMAAPMIMAQKAQATRDHLDQLTNNILELRSKVTDPVLNKYLSTSYKELTAYYDKDLADNQIIAQIKTKERAIREYLVEYNARDNDANSNNDVNSNNKDLNASNGHNILVKSICEIYDRPSYESTYLSTVKVGVYVQFIENFDDLWCKVRFGSIEGYAVKANLKFQE